MAIETRLGEDDVVERLAPQPRDHPQAAEDDAETGLAGQPVLELRVAVDFVDVRVAGKHGRVVGIHQRRDVRLRMTRAQRGKQRGRAHQVADVVAANDENAHASQAAVGALDCSCTCPQASRMPTTPQ